MARQSTILRSPAVLWLLGPPMEHSTERLRRAVGGRTILVTGASYGQGEATARLLAGAGAHVLLVARSHDRLETIVEEITATGGLATPYVVDLGDLRAVDDLAGRIVTDHGGVDVLVHNAGKSLRRSTYRSAQRRRDMDAMIGVNFLGPMRLTLALLPSMRARGSGHIINIATAGLWMAPAAPRWGFYLASKGGFDIWMRSAAMEVQADGIDVTTIYAGHIKSRMVATRWVSRMPGHTPSEAARVIGRALTRRPRTMAPRGMFVARVLGVAFEAPLSVLLRLADRRSNETPASEQAFLRAMRNERPAPAAADEELV